MIRIQKFRGKIVIIANKTITVGENKIQDAALW